MFRSDINPITGIYRALLSYEFLLPKAVESKWVQIMEDRVVEAYNGLEY